MVLLYYYIFYLLSVLSNVYSSYKQVLKWDKYIPKTSGTKIRKVNTKNLKTKTVKINNEKFSENIFLMMSLFFPYYEGGIVREVHVKDISENKYVSQQERTHIKVHTDLNNCFEKYLKSFQKYLKTIYNLYVSNRFTGIGNYIAEIGFYFKAIYLIPKLKYLVEDRNVQKVFAWHFYEELEHCFDFGLPVIQQKNIFIRTLCAFVGLIHYINIWLLCVELPSILLCLSRNPLDFINIFVKHLYINTWNKGKNDSLVLVSTILQKFPSPAEKENVKSKLKKYILDEYNLNLDDEVIYF